MPVKTSAGNVAVTVSIGVADVSGEEAEFEQVLEQADCAMRSAKETGRNRVVVVSELLPEPPLASIAPVAN